MSSGMSPAFIKQMQEKVEKELAEKEKETLEYWRGELDAIVKRRHQAFAALENDLSRIIQKMTTRLSRL